MRLGVIGACALTLAACTTAPASRSLAVSDLAQLANCLRESQQTLVSAHRGGYGFGRAETSLGAFAASVAQHPVLLETDVRRTADGVLVLMHDATVDRTTTSAGAVADMSAATFESLRLKDTEGLPLDEGPPTLAAALSWARGAGAILQLDVKRGVPFDEVVEAVQAAGAENQVIVIVYTLADAVTVHQLDPRLMLSVSIRGPEDVEALRTSGVDLSRVLAFTGIEAPNPELYAQLADAGLEVIFGTLGGPDSLDVRFSLPGGETGYARLREQGVHIIATSRPSAAFAALDAADGPGWGPQICLGTRP